MSELETPLPISSSADSKANGYTFACDIIGQRRVYPVCLNLIANSSDKRLEGLYPDCFGAIKKGSCHALQMRREESNAGHAIYFLDRSVDAVIPEYKGRKTRPSEPYVKPVTSKNDGDILSRIGDMDYTKVLNDAIAIETPKEKPENTIQVEKKETKKIEAVPGESLLDMARRMLAAKS